MSCCTVLLCSPAHSRTSRRKFANCEGHRRIVLDPPAVTNRHRSTVNGSGGSAAADAMLLRLLLLLLLPVAAVACAPTRHAHCRAAPLPKARLRGSREGSPAAHGRRLLPCCVVCGGPCVCEAAAWLGRGRRPAALDRAIA
jgi:hypothetical protein